MKIIDFVGELALHFIHFTENMCLNQMKYISGCSLILEQTNDFHKIKRRKYLCRKPI
jgi:hypothetical protein